ncbi:hypothetical protein [Planktotalea frisia]|uniref:hypothetical protein n=1 Tax=Planktotalea frisia TaxID=696762 RepID=UPI0015877E12|nr:hypothetical protein [Planktotalea frisia]
MDITALSFYAIICGVLSLAAPRFGGAWIRFGLGALVGILAALFLPIIKQSLGY